MKTQSEKQSKKAAKSGFVGFRATESLKERIQNVVAKNPDELDESKVVRKCVMAHLPVLELALGITPPATPTSSGSGAEIPGELEALIAEAIPALADKIRREHPAKGNKAGGSTRGKQKP